MLPRVCCLRAQFDILVWRLSRMDGNKYFARMREGGNPIDRLNLAFVT